jgi:EmrB/QacA subfamily drug resistance transporter
MLAILLVGQFMALLDATVVNVAMPTIGRDLRASGSALQMVVSGFTITYAVLLITGARLGSLYGRRRMYLIGLLGFTVTSLGCGLAPTTEVLIGARLLQGAAAAAMVPQIISVINSRFTGSARATALSAYSAVVAVGAVAGQILGGVLVSADIAGAGWRPIFLVNVPVGLALTALVARKVPADNPTGGHRLDLAGLGLIVAAVFLVVIPLVLGHQQGWPAWIYPALIGGLGLATAFVAVERRVRSPLLDLQVLRAAGLRSGLLTLAAGMIAYGGYIFVLSLHLQTGIGDSPLRAGATFAPAGVAFGAISLLWRKLPPRSHRHLTSLGCGLSAIVFVAIALDLRTGGSGGAGLLVILTLSGAFLGLAFGSVVTHAMANVPAAQAADASGLLTTTLQLSQVLGVAIFGSVFLSIRANANAHPSAHALTVTLALISGLLIAGAVGGVALGRAVMRDAVDGQGLTSP